MASESWPFVLEPAMPKPLFAADEFVPTEFSTIQDKAAFGNHFFRFIESEWKSSLFTKGFYNRLSSCFGHIAHYNLQGFYGTWFAHDEARLSFLRHTLRFPCYGDPAYTFSDVEQAIRSELRRRSLIEQYEVRVATATRARELAQLERLQAKYGPAPSAPVRTAPLAEPCFTPPIPVATLQRPTQISLF